MKIKMHPVNSSTISHIGYCNTRLFVKFKSGTTYRYEGITEEQNRKIMESESKMSEVKIATGGGLFKKLTEEDNDFNRLKY